MTLPSEKMDKIERLLCFLIWFSLSLLCLDRILFILYLVHVSRSDLFPSLSALYLLSQKDVASRLFPLERVTQKYRCCLSNSDKCYQMQFEIKCVKTFF